MPPGQVLTLFETKNVILHPLSDLAKGMQNGGQTDIIGRQDAPTLEYCSSVWDSQAAVTEGFSTFERL